MISLIHKILRALISEGGANSQAPHQALRGRKAVSEAQRTEDEDLPHNRSESEDPGVGFWRTRGGVTTRPQQRSKAKCKQPLKAITSRSRGQSLDAYRKELKVFVLGWGSDFAASVTKEFVRVTDEWFRRRIRQIDWSASFRSNRQHADGLLSRGRPTLYWADHLIGNGRSRRCSLRHCASLVYPKGGRMNGPTPARATGAPREAGCLAPRLTMPSLEGKGWDACRTSIEDALPHDHK